MFPIEFGLMKLSIARGYEGEQVHSQTETNMTIWMETDKMSDFSIHCGRKTYSITSHRRKSLQQYAHIFNFQSKKDSFPNISHPSNYEI